jgi:site-specific DNA-methyltransferase (adenine-specific)
MELKIEYVDINSIKPYKNNAKLHPQEQIEQIKKSIEQFGMDDPIGIWKDEIVEGHGRLLACKELGYKEVPIIRLDHLTDEERKAYTLAHNKLTMNSDFDIDILNEELENFDTIDMSDYGFDIDLDLDEEQEIVEDEVPEVTEEPKAKLGDIYQLGNHRLMCGDSTKEEDVAKLMNGVKADMVFTDPPYGVDYKGINNDDRSGLEELLDKAFNNMKNNCNEGSSVYCFHSDRCADIFNNIFRKYCHFSSMIIWKKPSLVLSQTDYQSIHEPCLYGWFDNGNHNFYGDRKQISVWEYDRENIEGHTTPKPVKLICNALNNSSEENNYILDLFGGSGSTLIACEQLNRKCYMMELDPHYIDVIIQRWENFTGEKAVKIN